MEYGKSLYSTFMYGTFVAPEPVDVEPVDMLQYLPPHFHKVWDFVKIMESQGYEFGLLRYYEESVLDQFFVQTATWGLALWEEEFGIRVEPAKPTQWRREQILAKIRGTGTVTKEMIKNTAEAFSGGEVDVIEYPEEYRFVVKFIGVRGIPPNMAGFIEALEQIKPAHLAYDFEYTYVTWGMLSNQTWDEIGTMTWDELKAYEGA